MTIYLIGGAVFLIILIYLYAKKEGFKGAALEYLEEGFKIANKVDENDQAKDKEINAKIEHFSGDNALNFWMRKPNPKESKDLSNTKET